MVHEPKNRVNDHLTKPVENLTKLYLHVYKKHNYDIL